jgi:hypothetical protein
MRLSKYLLILFICSIGYSQKYDPKTGELIKQEVYDPVTGELIKTSQYDPVTGEPIEDIPASKYNNTSNVKNSETKINNSLNSPSYLSIINAAKEEASQKNKKDTRTNIGAGASGCLFSVVGVVVGVPLASLYALLDTSGEPKSDYYNELSSQNKNIYKPAYKAEVNKLKQTSVFGTMGVVVGVFILTVSLSE